MSKSLEDKKEKIARKMAFEKDERKGIKEYKKAKKEAEGKEKKTYEKILPEEEKHLKKLKKI